MLSLALGDIAGGSHSLAEIDFIRFCRLHDLPEPHRQERRCDTQGRWRYLEVEWDLPDGRTLVVEIDGIGHMEVARWYDDLLRTAELPRDELRTLIRLPATAVRVDGLRVASIHLVPDGPQRVRPAVGRIACPTARIAATPSPRPGANRSR